MHCTYCSVLIQGCQQQLGLLFVEQLYSIGAIGMAFGVFEVRKLLTVVARVRVVGPISIFLQATSILVAMQHMQG